MPDVSVFSETHKTHNMLPSLQSQPENGYTDPNVKTIGEFGVSYRDLDHGTKNNGSRITIFRRNQKRLVRDALEDRKNTIPACRMGKVGVGKCLEDHLRIWVDKKVKSGVSESDCQLPFLVNAPRMVECRMCSKIICSGEAAVCTVTGCLEAYHITCAKQKLGFSSAKNFKCPQHHCFVCKQKGCWRCIRCPMAAHSKCAPWPDEVIYSMDKFGQVVCWRHPTNWRLEKKHVDPTSEVEVRALTTLTEIFRRLPVPYFNEEFKIGSMRKDMMENKMAPAPYVHIRRNVYLIKKKRNDGDVDIGCKDCNSARCSEYCECRVQSISCSKACHCSELCTNRPFRKEKKVKVVQTQICGWGVEAAEPIKNGDFVIEYIGEVIDDALCEARLWDMKYRGDQNFYICEIRKDFTIDATFKGNAARFLNHSCEPNCKLEKWQVDGKTCVGVFASQNIEVGEPLTYDYRFEHFGPQVECCCGASNCQGYLGSKRKIDRSNIAWGYKRKRSKRKNGII